MSEEFKSFSELVYSLYQYKRHGILNSKFVKHGSGITLKATGNSSLVDVDGGYLCGGEIISSLLHSISQKSSLYSKASKFYSSNPNSNKAYLPFVNESNRTDSAFNFHCYWIPEGSEKTRAKFSIGLAECKLNKIIAHLAITNELWSDSAMFKSAIERFITDKDEGSLTWYIEKAMLSGDGTSMFGIMSAGSNGTIGVDQADPLDEATLNAFSDALAPATHATAEWFMSEENFRELQAINFTNENDKYYKDGFIYIYGHKVNVLEQMETPYDLMLGDVSQYGIALKSDTLTENDTAISVLFPTDEQSIKFGIRINGKSFGSTYNLEDTTVGTFVVPSDVPAVESSSSSEIENWSSSSSSSSDSSSSSTSYIENWSSSSSDSESSGSSGSSGSSSSSSSSSEGKSESSSSLSSSSSSQSSGLLGPCEEMYTGSGFANSALNGIYTVRSTRYNSKATYETGVNRLFYSSSDVWVIGPTVGGIPSTWLATMDVEESACPAGAYNGGVGTIA